MLVVLGTRPKAIKLAPVVLALRARAGVDVRVCATGQHADLVDRAIDPLVPSTVFGDGRAAERIADHLCAEPQVSVAEAAR